MFSVYAYADNIVLKSKDFGAESKDFDVKSKNIVLKSKDFGVESKDFVLKSTDVAAESKNIVLKSKNFKKIIAGRKKVSSGFSEFFWEKIFEFPERDVVMYDRP